MYLTDNELCALEQLCYLDNNVAKAAGVNSKLVQTLREKPFLKYLQITMKLHLKDSRV